MSIEVTTWADFVTAVGTSGAEVDLPEEAVWDMNEILPHFNQNLTVSCSKINGNGTEIKNLHITGFFDVQSAVEIKDIKFTNILADGSGQTGWGENGFFNSNGSGNPKMNGCTVSGIFGNGYSALFAMNGYSNYWESERNGFNCDMQSGWRLNANGIRLQACRVFLNFPSASNTVSLGSGYTNYTEFVVNAPLAQSLTAYCVSSCTIRGNMQNVTQINAEGATAVSVYSTADMPNASVSQSWGDAPLIGVTDAQMKSAEYLRSIGFLIGSE